MYLGKPIKRIEDKRFLTGGGAYVDDLTLPGMAFGCFLRSSHAHARLVSVDVATARQAPGVLAVLTGADALAAGLGRFVVWSPVKSTDGTTRAQTTQFPLTHDVVRYVGEPIAFVVAETKQAAVDAVELIEVEYEARPAIVETSRSLDADAPVLHEEIGSNLVFDVEMGDKAATQAIFRSAFHVTELTLINNRITANPMEPRALLGLYERAGDRYTLWASHQAPHMLRRDLAETTLKHPEERIRVVAPDVGGGFGMKVANHPEEPVVLWASKVVGRPVKWASTRSEGLIADSQARDHWTKCRMAFDKDGRILALEADTLASLGAYQTRMGASIPSQFYSRSLSGLYKLQAAWCRVRGVHTNAAPVQAYRGAGRPEAIYVLESLVDQGARELGIDICDIRARSFIAHEEFPYKATLGLTYEIADPPALLEKARKLFGYDDLRSLQKERNASGSVRIGIGAACFIDCIGTPSKVAAGFGRKIVGGWDSATVRIHPSGRVTVLAGSHSHGQGHATTFAQIAAEALTCPIEMIDVVEGDTDRVQFGHGTWGSRSTVTSGIAVMKASALLQQKCRAIAAHAFEADARDVVIADGVATLIGTDLRMTFQDIAQIAYQGGRLPDGMDPALEQVSFHDPADRSYASGFHFCAVRVDIATGRVKIARYAVIDDCGKIINPIIIEGQAHGGVAQGIGQALMEECAFDSDSGQPLSGTFQDYAMPRASDFPLFKVGVHETASPSTPMGVKGAGESGTIGALAAVRNAVVDALWEDGVRHIDMPILPHKVWRSLRAARLVRAGVK
jgi:carbon-monoxide dehydrogenase large subunit